MREVCAPCGECYRAPGEHAQRTVPCPHKGGAKGGPSWDTRWGAGMPVVRLLKGVKLREACPVLGGQR